jgi:hypothetical protein
VLEAVRRACYKGHLPGLCTYSASRPAAARRTFVLRCMRVGSRYACASAFSVYALSCISKLHMPSALPLVSA